MWVDRDRRQKAEERWSRVVETWCAIYNKPFRMTQHRQEW